MQNKETPKEILPILKLIHTINYFNHDLEKLACEYDEEIGEVTITHYLADHTKEVETGSVKEITKELVEMVEDIIKDFK